MHRFEMIYGKKFLSISRLPAFKPMAVMPHSSRNAAFTTGIYSVIRTPIQPALGAPGDTKRGLLNASPSTSSGSPKVPNEL
jgi:hypothetical protein